MSNKLVFCKNCKYVIITKPTRFNNYRGGTPYCSRSSILRRNLYSHWMEIDSTSCCRKNKENNCTLYKKKWWKLWIK